MSMGTHQMMTSCASRPGGMGAWMSLCHTGAMSLPPRVVHPGETGLPVNRLVMIRLNMVITLMTMARHFFMVMVMPCLGYAGMPFGGSMFIFMPMPSRMAMRTIVSVRTMAYPAMPDPVRRSIAGKMIGMAFGRGAEVRHRITPALGAALMHPALDFAHPVTVVHGLGFVIILFVIVGGSQINCAIRVGMITRCEAVSRKGEKPYDNG